MSEDQITCSVPNCRFVSNSFFEAPTNPVMLEKWKKALNFKIPEVGKAADLGMDQINLATGEKDQSFQICPAHFEDRYLKHAKMSLNPEAVPSLFLNLSKIENVCQSCLKKNISIANEKIYGKDFFTITEAHQIMFEKLVNLKLPAAGLICKKCYRQINNFNSFREYINQLQRKRLSLTMKKAIRTYNRKPKTYSHKLVASKETKKVDYNETQSSLVIKHEDELDCDENSTDLLQEISNDDDGITMNENYEIEDQIISYNPPSPLKLDFEESDDSDEDQSVSTDEEPNESEESDDDDVIFDKEIVPSTSSATVEKFIIRPVKTSSSLRPRQELLSYSTPKRVRIDRTDKITSPYTSSLKSNEVKLNQQIKCQYCIEKFTDRKSLVHHLDTAHKFQCPSCPGVTFPYEITLIQHRVTHSNQVAAQTARNSVAYKFDCHICRLKFLSNESLARHLSAKHEIKVECIDGVGEDDDKVDF